MRAHNRYRNMHQVGDLIFDADLAAGAQTFASKLARDGKLSYSTPAAAGAPPNSGENVAVDARTDFLSTTGLAVDNWYFEATKYDFARSGYQPGTSQFTQIVWKGTTRVGCGIDGKYVVCRYAAPGNIVGYFPSNVFSRGVGTRIKNAGETCDAVDGKRAACAAGLCCGQSAKVGNRHDYVEHCMKNTLTKYTTGSASWKFSCIEAGTKLVASAAAILASLYAMLA